MKTWLKVLAVIFLVYAVVASLMFPLAPGGLTVDIEKITPGENNFTFTGYNTHFKNDSLQVFVASSNTYFCCTVLEVIDDSRVRVSAALPDTLPSNDIGFYANTPVDGTVYVQKPIGSKEFTFIEGAKPMSACEVKVANDEHREFGYPFQIIIFETIRNLMWHVPMWFTMFVLMGISFAQSIRVLAKSGREDSLDASISFKTIAMFDLKAATAANTGLLFCILGLITGSIWARFTWGDWWTNDPQLNGAMVVFLMYMAYFILRNSVNDEEKRARLAAIFNIFAFILMVVLLMVMPRFAEGLHPGKSGNPAFSSYDLDSSLRMVFYPAVIGYILLGWWLYSVHLRIKKLEWRDEK
jgi:heme exporter protein C